jgi:TonB family protein
VGIPGQAAPRQLVAVVTDRGYNRLEGLQVQFKAIKGRGSFANGQQTTAAATEPDGRAIVSFTLEPVDGGASAGLAAGGPRPGGKTMTRAPWTKRRDGWMRCAAVMVAALALPAAAAAGRRSSDDPEVGRLLAQGEAQLGSRQLAAAAESFGKANEAAGGRCGECLLGLARTRRPDGAIATTRQAIAALEGSPLLGRAYCQLGRLLLLDSRPQAAAEAEAAYTSALGAGAGYRGEAELGIAEARLRRQLYDQAMAAAQEVVDVGGRWETRGRSMICRVRNAGKLPPQPAAAGAAADPQGDKALHVGGAVTKPEKIYAMPPVYTEQARKARLQGVVILEGVIDRDGCVTDLQVLKPLPMGLDRAAVDAASGWVFKPATLAGRPVRVYYSLTINFEVQPAPATPDE